MPINSTEGPRARSFCGLRSAVDRSCTLRTGTAQRGHHYRHSIGLAILFWPPSIYFAGQTMAARARRSCYGPRIRMDQCHPVDRCSSRGIQLAKLHLDAYVMCAITAIVGLHMFPLRGSSATTALCGRNRLGGLGGGQCGLCFYRAFASNLGARNRHHSMAERILYTGFGLSATRQSTNSANTRKRG